MWNVKFNLKHFFYILLIQTKKVNKENKTKQLLKFIKVFNLPVEMGNSKSCQYHAARASFILIMLFSSLEGDIACVSKITTSGN